MPETTAAPSLTASAGAEQLHQRDANEIIPPPGIREIADKTAKFIAKSTNGLQFEERLRELNRADPKFGFLNPLDPYHLYYKNRVKLFAANPNAGSDQQTGAPFVNQQQQHQQQQQQNSPQKPQIVLKDYEFCHPLPSISASDLAVVKLTAQFVARNGRTFLTSLAGREQRNPQFDFLRQNHSLHAYFNALVSQYMKILMPIKSQSALLSSYADSSSFLLSHIEVRAQMRARVEADALEKEKEAEEERRAFAEIDWHDFVVVDTVEFLEGDEGQDVEFALPISVAELKGMTLVEKSKLVESTMAVPLLPSSANQFPPTPSSTLAPKQQQSNDDDMDMDEDDDEDNELAANKPKPSNTITPSIPRLLPQHQPPGLPKPPTDIKIRANYAPKVGTSGSSSSSTSEPTQLCPRCGQSIKVSEMAEHMRIELLDPKWRLQKQAQEAKQRSSASAMSQVDVAKNLTKLSDYRSDIFGGGGVESEVSAAAAAARKAATAEKEKIVWDGHSTSIGATTAKVQMQAMDAQMEILMNPGRAAALLGEDAYDDKKVGPQLPAATAIPQQQQRVLSMPPPPMSGVPPLPPIPSSLQTPRPPVAVAPSMAAPPPLPPVPTFIPPPGFTGLGAPVGLQVPPGLSGVSISGPPIMAPPPIYPGALTQPPPPPPEDFETPDAKRIKLGDSGSDLIPEAVFIASNPDPISLTIQDAATGTNYTLPVAVAPATKINKLREIITDKLSGFPAAGKQRIATQQGVFLKNELSLAYYNIRTGDVLVVKLQTRGGGGGAAAKK